MSTPSPEDRQRRIDDAVRNLHVMNDQLAVFHATRAIAFGTNSPAYTAEAIRELYRDFDRKHPNALEPPKGAEK
ncbi:hypothetical protein [Mycobacterium sp. 1465703.0]|uniref:hypothetical protein n=1 Tax=Mycobacterium sp. 1465703.0 TaxID=1834078 RepID=UPI0008013C43|nr:hypothetical protein [Mycobacterium sp. 1465703.0]OBI95570.1 hypothetical protein A5625_08120 [Mycobacterium sp. 1465703.0]